MHNFGFHAPVQLLGRHDVCPLGPHVSLSNPSLIWLRRRGSSMCLRQRMRILTPSASSVRLSPGLCFSRYLKLLARLSIIIIVTSKCVKQELADIGAWLFASSRPCITTTFPTPGEPVAAARQATARLDARRCKHTPAVPATECLREVCLIRPGR